MLDSLLPLITCLSNTQLTEAPSDSVEANVIAMARDLQVAVATRGVVNMKLSNEEVKQNHKSHVCVRPGVFFRYKC